MQMAQAQRHPLDWDAINPGDYIPPELIERWAETTRDNYKAYQLKLLAFKTLTERELVTRGLCVFVKIEKEGIRIVPPNEAPDYARQQRKRAIRQFGVRHRILAGTDVTQIDADTIEDFQREHTIHAAQLQALLATEKKFKRLPSDGHKRETPGLPEK